VEGALDREKPYLALLTDIMHTQLHITWVLTGTFEYFPDYWTRCF